MTNLRRLALALLLSGTPAAWGQTIHLLTVGDTLDANIGSGTAANNKQITDFITKAAAEMKLTLSSQDISGTSFSCQKIKEAVVAMQAKEDDVVIFYYSGHGFRTQSNVSKFPELYCGEEAFAGKAPRLIDIASQLKQKGARLTITVADSCNVLDTQPQPPKGAGAIASLPVSRLKQYRSLFLRHKGTLTMSGSVKGQYSWYYPTNGLFTRQLIGALEVATQPDREGLWTEVLAVALTEIQVTLPSATVRQTPESDAQLALLP